MDENYCIAQELKMIRTMEDEYFKYDDFVTGKRKLLFITGLSGGGKSTLAKKIAEEVHGIAFPLDMFYHLDKYNDWKKMSWWEPEAIKLLEKYASARKFYSKDMSGNQILGVKMTGMIAAEICKDFCMWLMKTEASLSKPVIVEGIQLHLYVELADLIIGYPLIIKNTSTITSFTRAAKRDFHKTVIVALFKRLVYDGTSYIDWYMEMTKYVNRLRDKYNDYLS